MFALLDALFFMFACLWELGVKLVAYKGYRMEPEHEGGQLFCFYAPRAIEYDTDVCC